MSQSEYRPALDAIAELVRTSIQPMALAKRTSLGDWELEGNEAFAVLCGPGGAAGRTNLRVSCPMLYTSLQPALAKAARGEASKLQVKVEGAEMTITSTPATPDGVTPAVLLIAQLVEPEVISANQEAALLHAIAEALPDAIYAKDADGRLLFANRTTLELIGSPEASVLGRTDAEVLADECVAQVVMDTDRDIMTRGELREVVERVPNRDGKERVWHSYKAPWRNSRGEVIGLLGISRDITERLHLEDQLTQSRQTLDDVLESITDGFAVLNRDWRYTYFNEQGARMLGVRREDILGGYFWELFPHARTTRFGQEYIRCFETGEASSFEDFYPEPLNKWIECHCYPSPDGLAVFFRDVTEKHRLEREARQSSERLARLFAASPIGLVTGCAEGKILEANDAFLRIIGRTHDDLQLGRIDWRQITPAEWLPVDAAAVDELRTNTVSALYEKEYVHADGHRVPIVIGLARFDDAAQVLIGFVLDITDRKRAETALLEADRRKNEFLAMLAHELRNPMAPLRSGLNILERQPDPAKIAGTLRIMNRQMNQLVRLVDDLLDIARISTGKINVDLQAGDLREACQLAVEACGPAIRNAEHTLSTRFPPIPVWVRVDQVRMTQVVSNLLHNACKYTPRGGRIELELSITGREAVATVTDTGPGIKPELQPSIFDLFVQDGNGETTQGGLGVGLALVRELVRLHGGTVALTSEVGRGSCFAVRLPLLNAD